MTRLQEIMGARGVHAADLARLATVDPSTISKLVRGARELRRHWAERLSPHLDVTPDDLLASVGAPIPPGPTPLPARFAPGSDVQPAPGVPPLQPRRVPGDLAVPVRGVVQGGPGDFFDVNLSDGPLEYVEVLPGLVGMNPGDLFALFVAGESMAPVWGPGDTVYVAKKRPITPGCYVVALVDRGPGEGPGGLLKQFMGRDDGRVTLRQHNPERTMEVERARVREMWRALHWRELVG